MEIYLVRPGDEPAALARRFGLSLEALAELNQLGDPRRLSPGQCLLLAESSQPAGAERELCAALSPRAEARLAQELLPMLSWLCIQSASVTENGELSLPDDAWLIKAALDAGAAPLLSIGNLGPGGFSALSAHRLFSREDSMQALIANTLKAVRSKAYYGVELNFQYLYPFDREAYTAFVCRMAQALHSAGCYLFCSLAPKSPGLEESPLCAAHDYAALGRAADRLILLCHDWGGPYSSPQAVAPADRSAAVLAYASSLIPPGKCLLSLSCWGCSWPLPWRQGEAARLLPARLAVDMAVSAGAQIRYDRAAQAPFFTFTDGGGQRRLVWFEDCRSLKARLEPALAAGIGGISLCPRDRLYRPALKLLGSLCTGVKLI